MADSSSLISPPGDLGPGDLPPLRMRESHRDAILAHCRNGLPYEACGLLFGKGETAEVVRPMRNAARSTTFYTLDPAEQLQVMEEAQDAGLDMVGIFHSHPVTRPYPSRTDVDFAGFWEECWFLIASFRHEAEPELCCYRIIGDTVVETGVELTPG